jgi:SWI/SNF-related matrix-associated actin-dependent regulator 1 of chromatin subfamily A
LAAKRVQELGAFNVVICDESHYLKSHKTKRTKKLRPLVVRTPHAFLLTGTPAANRPVELYSQISMLQPKCFGTYTNFVERYCGAKYSPLGFVDVSGATHKEELAFRLRQTCMIRRLKRDVLTDLPPKTRTRVDLDVPRNQKITRKQKRWKDINGMEETRELVLERQRIVSELFRLTCAAKESAVKKYCADLPPNVIVFAYHQRMLDAVQEALPDSIRIDGSTPMDQRQKLVDMFQAGEVPYAVLSIAAAGTGLTITACSTVVFAELYYVPGSLLQAEDRTHRIGQTQPVDVRYLCGTHTLDDHVYNMVSKKLRTTDACLDGRTDRTF